MHLLQEDDIGADLAHRVAQFAQHEAPLELAEALVRVHGQDANHGAGRVRREAEGGCGLGV
ncbi:hypothetical protein D3C83_276890 [compost metagenome]